MGCDIHFHVEIKVKGVWRHYAFPKCERNYQIFGKLGADRGYSQNGFKSKGLPKDLSVVTEIDAKKWEADMHHQSWITRDEIIEFSEWIAKEKPIRNTEDLDYDFLYNDLEFGFLNTYFFGNSFSGFWLYPEDAKEMSVEDIRFVFWFDN